MSERPEAEIEDVLTSIRRLVAGERSAPPPPLTLVEESEPQPSSDDPGDVVAGNPDAFVFEGEAPYVEVETPDPQGEDGPEEAVSSATLVLAPEHRLDEEPSDPVADDMAFQESVPEEAVPEEPQPQETTSDGAVPEATEPEGAVPEDNLPDDGSDAMAQDVLADEAEEFSDALPESEPSVDENLSSVHRQAHAGQADMAARVGAMRALWETDAESETVETANPEPLIEDAAAAPEEGAAPVTQPTEPSTSSDHPREMSERRPIWSRAQTEIETAVMEELEADVASLLRDAAPSGTVERSPVSPTLGSESVSSQGQQAEEEPSPVFTRARKRVPESTEPDFPDNLFGPEPGFDDAAMRAMIVSVVHEELQGALGERITRNVRKLVRREIQRALASRDFD